MSKQAKGMYNDILDSTRGEYERAMWGRKTTEDLDIHEPTPPEGHHYGAVDTSTDLEQQQEIDDDLEI